MYEQNARKKKIKIRYRLSVVFFGAVLIFGFMFYKYMRSVTLEDVLSQDRNITFFNHASSDSEEDQPRGGEPESEGENAEAPQQNEIVNPVAQSEREEEDYLKDCAFVGDDLIYGLGLEKYGGLGSSSNILASMSLGVSNISADNPSDSAKISFNGEESTAIEALEKLKPENLYVMLGTKDAAYLSSDEIFLKYQAFMNKARISCPDSKIYIISAPPVTSAKESAAGSPIKNSVVDELNSKLLEYADNNGLYYLDLNSYLKDGDGFLRSDCAENDGLHFNSSAYGLFIEYILTHVAN